MQSVDWHNRPMKPRKRESVLVREFARRVVAGIIHPLRHSALVLLLALVFPFGAMAEVPFRNPILAGFKPDPSIVRVGEDYYLVNSSFEYFPALPVHHSRDLVNWRLLGYAVSSPAGLGLEQAPSSGGIQAATIRHHAAGSTWWAPAS